MATSIAGKMTDISVDGRSLYHQWIAKTMNRREGHIGRRKCGVIHGQNNWFGVVGCKMRFVIVTYSYSTFTSRSDMFRNRSKIYVLFPRIPNIQIVRTKLPCGECELCIYGVVYLWYIGTINVKNIRPISHHRANARLGLASWGTIICRIQKRGVGRGSAS